MSLAASDICAAVDVVTGKSQSCQGPANQINIINIALAVSGFGPIPVVVTRLNDIISYINTNLAAISRSQPFTTKSDQDTIVQSLTTSVQVQQALLNILIGKAGLVPNLIPFVGPPVAATLRQYESIMDTLFFEVIDLVPDNAEDATKQKNSLDTTMSSAITAWQQTITAPA